MTLLFILLVLLIVVISLAVEDTFKCAKKKIVVEIYKGGFGNKICGIVTGVTMALEMGRTVEIEWDSSQHLKGNYDDFFISPSSVVGQNFPFMKRFNLTEHAAHDVISSHTRCTLDLQAGVGNKLHTYWFFKNREFFNKLNQDCDLIRIKSNVDLSPLFQEPSNVESSARFQAKLPRIIHDLFAQGFLTLQPGILQAAQSYMKSVNWVKGGPVYNYVHLLLLYCSYSLKKTPAAAVNIQAKVASLHSRGLFDGDAKLTTTGIQCAKSLVDKGVCTSTENY